MRKLRRKAIIGLMLGYDITNSEERVFIQQPLKDYPSNNVSQGNSTRNGMCMNGSTATRNIILFSTMCKYLEKVITFIQQNGVLCFLI